MATNLTTEQTAAILTRKFLVVKGSKVLGIQCNQRVRITGVTPMGADFSHAAKVTVVVGGAAQRTLWVSHPNRLLDENFNLSDGGDDKIRLN